MLAGCQSAYYAAWEKLGVEKRDILVDRVEDARESQEDAQEQFASALEQFSALINFDGGELQDVYEQLNDEYESSSAAADAVTARIDSVESVAEALFDEWNAELDSYTNANLRRDSERQLKQTQRRYAQLVRSMRNAEQTMQPVLASLKDNVLYLKHNLNASAIGALQGELTTIRNDVNRLIKEMNAAIVQSDEFIKSING
jgi:septal ring factor EnvC (AmiA/AmiB activator)